MHSISTQSSNCISEVSCSLLSCSLFKDSIPIPTPYFPCGQQVVTSNTGPILVFPRMQSLGKVYSRQATESVNCKNSSVSFVMKYCPTSTVVRHPASIQNFIPRSCCDNCSIPSWYHCNRSKIFFLCKIIGQEFVCLHHTWHEQWVGLSCHNKSPCSILARTTFFTKIRDCSVNGNNCAKNSFNRLLIGTELY